MAWTSLGPTPGNAGAPSYIDPASPGILNYAGTVKADTNDLAYSLGVDVPRRLNTKSPLGFPNVINQGWINFSANGGGGGSTRPSSGFLYPRGN